MKQFINIYLCCYSSSCKTSSLYTTNSCYNCKYAGILGEGEKKKEGESVFFYVITTKRILAEFLTVRVRAISDQAKRNFKTKLKRSCQVHLLFFYGKTALPEFCTSPLYYGLTGFVGLLPSKWFLLCLPIKNPWPVPPWLAKSMGVRDLFWGVFVCKKERHRIS